MSIYIMARTGKLQHFEHNEGFQATMRVMDAMGLEQIVFDRTTAEPAEEQFWKQFDNVYNLNEAEMRQQLPYFVTDPNNRAKVEALLAEEGDAKQLSEETTTKLNA